MSEQNLDNSQSSPLVRLALAAACGFVSLCLLFLCEQQILSENAGGKPIPILIAKSQLNAGDRITPELIEIQSIPQAYAHLDDIRSDAQNMMLFRRVKHNLKPKQPLMWSDLEAPERARIVAPLSKGLRLTSLAVGEQLAKSRFLSPGDFIDIVSHLGFGDSGSVTTMLLQRIQVMEISHNTAVVALSPEQFEQIAFARSHGTLTFAVRNYADIEIQSLPPVTSIQLPGNLTSVAMSLRASTALPATVKNRQTPQSASKNHAARPKKR